MRTRFNRTAITTTLFITALGAVLLSIPIALQAQIGCTLDQCREHYGTATAVSSEDNPGVYNNTYAFKDTPAGNYNVYASFSHDGKCDRISYVGLDHSGRIATNGFTDRDIHDFLEMNTNGFIWTRTGTEHHYLHTWINGHITRINAGEIPWYSAQLARRTALRPIPLGNALRKCTRSIDRSRKRFQLFALHVTEPARKTFFR
jgi:hypothetical protein